MNPRQLESRIFLNVNRRFAAWIRPLREAQKAAFAGTVLCLIACNGRSAGTIPTIATTTYHGEDKKRDSGELLYASSGGNDVLVFSYPQGRFVEKLTGFAAPPSFICSDSAGDVFVPASNSSSSAGYIYEFAHGGSQAVKTLSDPGP